MLVLNPLTYYSYFLLILMHARIRNSYRLSTRKSLRNIINFTKQNMKREFPANYIDADEVGLEYAARIIRNGGLVAFPTETVYGLGASALNSTAVDRIFNAKQRPHSDPLIVHVLSISDIYELFDFETQSDGLASKRVCEILCENFWPGPLTLIYHASSKVPSTVTSGTGFVGLRSPVHAIARALISKANLPIAAPSANRFGHVSPTTAEHVFTDLDNAPEEVFILRDDISTTGGCKIGIESTVCRLLPNKIEILRSGAITSNDIMSAITANGITNYSIVIKNNHEANSIDINNKGPSSTSSSSNQNQVETEVEVTVSPGQLIRHYSPDIPTYILPAAHDSIGDDAGHSLDTVYSKSYIIDYGQMLITLKHKCIDYFDLSPLSNSSEACGQIFDILRRAESKEFVGKGVEFILLPDIRHLIKNDEILLALWDKFHRAASGTFLTVDQLSTF